MHAMSLIFVVACLLFGTGCDEKTPAAPSVPLNERFTLAPGEAATIQGSRVRVEFVRVSGDSRCPADAICIQGGDALVHIRAGAGSMMNYELHTGDEARAAINHDGYRIELVNLQPYPFSSRTIQPEEYRAILRVSRD